MKIDSKNIVLNILGEANIQINKKLLLTLGLELSFFVSYLIDQYKFFEREGKLREDNSFYTTNMSVSLYTTLNDSQIIKLKKIGSEISLFKYSLEDSRTKTYYYLNFDKILEILGTEKNNLELAYTNVFGNKNMELEINTLEDIQDIKNFTVKELRFYCKKNQITYSGNDSKNILIGKIIKSINKEIFDISEFSIVDAIPVTNQEHNNQEKISCHVRDKKIEKIFLELKVNYTNSNVESTNLILKKLNYDKNLLIDYLTKLANQLRKGYKINNFSALFSSKLKTPDNNLIKKLLQEKENNEQKILEGKKEKIKQKEVEKKEQAIKEENIKAELILQKLNTLDKKLKDLIINKAIEETLKANPEYRNILNLDVYSFGIIQCKIVFKNLEKILKEENFL